MGGVVIMLSIGFCVVYFALCRISKNLERIGDILKNKEKE